MKRKQHRIKFLKEGSTKSKQILGLIHFNICGPLQTHAHIKVVNALYNLIDDKAIYCFVYLMKTKCEAFDKFIIFKTFVEKHY
jgi:hypothetical protein